MPSSRLALVAATMLLSTGFVVVPHAPANAAKFCAQLRGSTAKGHRDCSFSTLEAYCYKLHH